jgi:hypothetical protein
MVYYFLRSGGKGGDGSFEEVRMEGKAWKEVEGRALNKQVEGWEEGGV